MSFANRSVNVHQFSMVPRPDVPRSSFNIEFTHKSTFDAGFLIPIFCEEVLPGDTFKVDMTAFARLATPIFPLMDNIHIDTFFFFVPNRLVWDNWVKFMGEQANPIDSISYLVPNVVSPAGLWPVGSIYDYFGLPTVGMPDGSGQDVAVSALPLRGYNLIWNEWFRDQNLQNSVTVKKDDTADNTSTYTLLRRAKRPDYFTTALPWPQKGATAVALPLGTSAPIRTSASVQVSGVGPAIQWEQAAGGTAVAGTLGIKSTGGTGSSIPGAYAGTQDVYPRNLYADLSAATAATITQLRQAFQIQRLLERDARGGTRYTEIVQAHFGVRSPDSRLQRPEYLGGGSTPMMLTPIAQQSGTGASGTTAPLGTLGAIGTGVARHGFSSSFVEHGYIIGLVNIRADVTYQQGVRRHWWRSTRYDFYFPAFAHLGEQAVLRREIYCTGNPSSDNTVFGYQERWAELRYSPSMVTGLFRSYAAGTLAAWHLAEYFGSAPVLGSTFIEQRPPMDRILAVGAAANGQQIIWDSMFRMRVTRPIPLYSVPGMIDHF